MRRRDQDLARQAWDVVATIEQGDRAEFRSRAMELPAMLQSSGLAATVMFLAAKGGPGRHLLVAMQTCVKRELRRQEDLELERWLMDVDLVEYRRASSVTRALAGWIRRATEAELGPEEKAR